MAEQKPFLDRLKDATNTVATRAREGIEELQTKHELSQVYGDLGRKTAELVESGGVSHPELTELVEKIRSLKAELESAPGDAQEPSEPPAEG